MNSPISLYLRAAPAVDPVYAGIRRRVFDASQRWIELDHAWLNPVSSRLLGLPVRALEPALGWEQRPWTNDAGDREIPKLLDALTVRGDWDICHLNVLSPEESLQAQEHARALGFGAFEFDFPVSVIKGIGSYEEFLKKRDRVTNSKQRRSFRRVQESGLFFREELTWEHIEQVLDSRRLQGVDDYTQTPEFRAFFKEFREQMHAEGRLMEVGLFNERNQPVAYDSGFWTGRVFHAYQTAHNPEYRPYRPGILAFEKVIERALDRGCDLMDFMGSGRPYFHDFTRDEIVLKRVTVFSRSWRARLLAPLFGLKNRRSVPAAPAVLQPS